MMGLAEPSWKKSSSATSFAGACVAEAREPWAGRPVDRGREGAKLAPPGAGQVRSGGMGRNGLPWSAARELARLEAGLVGRLERRGL
jgi:hypothetical protein